MIYYTYVLKSERDNKLYIGSTNNLRSRKILHDQGKVPSTKNRRPLKLVYYEACRSKMKSLKREKYIKTGFEEIFKRSYLTDIWWA